MPDLSRRTYSGSFARHAAQAGADLGLGPVAFEAAGVTYLTYRQLAATGIELVATEDSLLRLRTEIEQS